MLRDEHVTEDSYTPGRNNLVSFLDCFAKWKQRMDDEDVERRNKDV